MPNVLTSSDAPWFATTVCFQLVEQIVCEERRTIFTAIHRIVELNAAVQHDGYLMKRLKECGNNT